MSIVTSFTGRTLSISQCPRRDWDDNPDNEPCVIAELDHYGVPTGELYCYTHAAVVGTVTQTCA